MGCLRRSDDAIVAAIIVGRLVARLLDPTSINENPDEVLSRVLRGANFPRFLWQPFSRGGGLRDFTQ